MADLLDAGEAEQPVSDMVAHDELGLVRGARRAVDAGDVVGSVLDIDFGPVRMGRDAGEEFLGTGVAFVVGLPAGKPGDLAADALGHPGAVEILVPQREFRPDGLQQFRDMGDVHLDIQRADHRADAPNSDPNDELLEAFVRQKNDAIAPPDSMIGKPTGNAVGDLAKFSERDRPVPVKLV